ILAAIVVNFALIGAFADRNSLSDVWIIVFFGSLAYLFHKFDFPVSPMVLGAILGPIAEDSFMRSMITFHNDITVFFTSPISGTLMVLSIVSLIYPFLKGSISKWMSRRAERRSTLAANG